MTYDVQTLGRLKTDPRWRPALNPDRSVRDEIRRNALRALREGRPLFPGIHGYDETVIPGIVNAVLSRHHFILLGLRGQAKSRILRDLVHLLDEWIPVVQGCEINDHPLRPLCRRCRILVEEKGEDTPVAFLHRDRRYVEKLATPDVTVADLIGDIDPIRAAHGGYVLADERVIHFGLLPRAHRGIFAMNELPDLAPKVQVALFNIMQEGDVQIKGFPVRIPLDVLMVFTANPEDYTARGKIITPLKDRIGSEIRTHYPEDRRTGMAVTQQEAWWDRGDSPAVEVPEYIRAVVEEVAFQARQSRYIDQRSGVSQRLPITLLEQVVSNAEQRACRTRVNQTTARVLDVYRGLPAVTGKLELEYEGEMKGPEEIAERIVRQATAVVFAEYFQVDELGGLIRWFDAGGSLLIPEWEPAEKIIPELEKLPGLTAAATKIVPATKVSPAALLSAAEFVLEGLWAHKRIARHPTRGYVRAEVRTPVRIRPESLSDPHVH